MPISSRAEVGSPGLRLVAAFEAAKGFVVLLAGMGLFKLVHHDVQAFAEGLVAHTHLNPANGYPRIFLDLAGRITDGKLLVLASLALAYSLIRLGEAYGLWFDRQWAQWLGVASGGIYVPIELYELFHHASWVKLISLLANVGVVVFLVQRIARHSNRITSLESEQHGRNPGDS
jgi:uncharacterized membrane protein (DUF2068 family)